MALEDEVADTKKAEFRKRVQNEFYENFIRGDVETSLALEELTGIKPDKETIVSACADLMKKSFISYILDLKEAYEVPALSYETVQNKYKELFNNLNIYEMTALKKLSGIEPSIPDFVVQRTYLKVVAKKEFHMIVQIYDLLNSPSMLPAKLIQEAYKDAVKWNNYDMFLRLEKATGIPPSAKIKKAIIRGLLS